MNVCGLGSVRGRALAVVVALAALSALAAGALGAHVKPGCAVSPGWRVVAKDAQAVVIHHEHRPFPVYAYCSRPAGRLHKLSLISGQRIIGTTLKLRGAYVTAAFQDASFAGEYGVAFWNLRSGKDYDIGGNWSSPPSVLLSPTGVAVWIATLAISVPHAGPQSVFVVTDPKLFAPATLDSGDDLANLQLYRCAAGCAPRTTVVAWTHSGQQRYYTIS
jgi:hypothetical protein